MGRLLALFGGVAWLVAMGLIAVAVRSSGWPHLIPPLATVPTLIRELNAVRPSSPADGESWIVTRVTSAHHVLIVIVEADRVGDARAIGKTIVEPMLKRGYDEILVYVWLARGQKEFADRRVQWTRAGGYKELVISD